MTAHKYIRTGILWGLIVLVAACVVEPREGFYDRGHHRYYHNHHWHACVDRDVHCR